MPMQPCSSRYTLNSCRSCGQRAFFFSNLIATYRGGGRCADTAARSAITRQSKTTTRAAATAREVWLTSTHAQMRSHARMRTWDPLPRAPRRVASGADPPSPPPRCSPPTPPSPAANTSARATEHWHAPISSRHAPRPRASKRASDHERHAADSRGRSVPPSAIPSTLPLLISLDVVGQRFAVAFDPIRCRLSHGNREPTCVSGSGPTPAKISPNEPLPTFFVSWYF